MPKKAKGRTPLFNEVKAVVTGNNAKWPTQADLDKAVKRPKGKVKK